MGLPRALCTKHVHEQEDVSGSGGTKEQEDGNQANASRSRSGARLMRPWEGLVTPPSCGHGVAAVRSPRVCVSVLLSDVYTPCTSNENES